MQSKAIIRVALDFDEMSFPMWMRILCWEISAGSIVAVQGNILLAVRLLRWGCSRCTYSIVAGIHGVMVSRLLTDKQYA